MFNKDIPYNDLPHLPVDFNFDDPDILKLAIKASVELADLKGSSKTIPNKNLLLKPLSIREAVSSNAVENINTTVSEVFQAEISEGKEFENKASRETLYYREALLKGNNRLKEKGFLNINDFLDIQSVIEPYKKGIRTMMSSDCKIVNKLTGETIYTPPEGYDLLFQKLTNYENYYNNHDDDPDHLIRMAILHYQFEAIHPFKDGNGRTGRILMVLYLVLSQRLDFPILFISGYILDNRSSYYEVLRNVTEKNDWKSFIIFMLNAVYSQSIATKKLINGINDLMEDYKTKVHSMGISSFLTTDMIDYLFSNPFYSIRTMKEKLNIHRNTARSYFKTLQDIGIVKEFKTGKENIFFNEKFLEILS